MLSLNTAANDRQYSWDTEITERFLSMVINKPVLRGVWDKADGVSAWVGVDWRQLRCYTVAVIGIKPVINCPSTTTMTSPTAGVTGNNQFPGKGWNKPLGEMSKIKLWRCLSTKSCRNCKILNKMASKSMKCPVVYQESARKTIFYFKGERGRVSNEISELWNSKWRSPIRRTKIKNPSPLPSLPWNCVGRGWKGSVRMISSN